MNLEEAAFYIFSLSFALWLLKDEIKRGDKDE
jgi:hypothetical protein